jgi:gamma-glutamyltranspeptidase/glutathione hydrolase
LTLGVVDGHNSGIGGGCFILIRRPDGQLIAIDGRETAPALATRDMFIRNGNVDPQLSQNGALASGVPGALAAYDHAVRKYGKMPLNGLLIAAARIAEDGFAIDANYARRLESTAKDLKQFESTRRIFLDGEGQPRKRGDILKQPDLAVTYRAIAADGIDWFYRGPFSKATAEWMRENGGLLTGGDFERYPIRIREPIRSTYRGYEIIGFPPPSSGGVHVAQILNILEQFDLRSMGINSPEFVHVAAEAMKIAFADRAFWLGDPDFAEIPRGLISKDYAIDLAKRISMNRTTAVPTHSAPPSAASDIFKKHTTHFSTADAEGNWVACTATINTSFGSKVVVPGTGVLLNNQMDDFSAQPGTANFFGLVGAEANAIAPGKRPLSSMSPTIILKDGRPVLSVGAAGGPTIISQTVLAIVATVDFGMEVREALARPRFHHQWKPDELLIETRIGEGVIAELQSRGHKIKRTDAIGATQAVGIESSTPDKLVGVHDPRLAGGESW